MMATIVHPDSFKSGTRVLMLKGRHKDGIEKERQIMRVSHDEAGFDATLAQLLAMALPGERIYASAGERCMRSAVRVFKQRQLDADYDDDPMRFYRGIEARWVSALMAPTCQATKLWLFDCDDPSYLYHVLGEIAQHYDRPMSPYRYPTKSGAHVIVQPFDRSKISERARGMIHENPIMLWAY